jgi:hypothetical protein
MSAAAEVSAVRRPPRRSPQLPASQPGMLRNQGVAWPDSGRTTLRNTGQRCAPVSVTPPRQKAYAQVVGSSGTIYGSEDGGSQRSLSLTCAGTGTNTPRPDRTLSSRERLRVLVVNAHRVRRSRRRAPPTQIINGALRKPGQARSRRALECSNAIDGGRLRQPGIGPRPAPTTSNNLMEPFARSSR